MSVRHHLYPLRCLYAIECTDWLKIKVNVCEIEQQVQTTDTRLSVYIKGGINLNDCLSQMFIGKITATISVQTLTLLGTQVPIHILSKL